LLLSLAAGERGRSPERCSGGRLFAARKNLFGEARGFDVGQLWFVTKTGGCQARGKTGNLFRRIAPLPVDGSKERGRNVAPIFLYRSV